MNPNMSLDLAAAMSNNLLPAGQAPQPESRSNDKHAARAELQPDGSYRYVVEGTTGGNYAEAVKSKSDPWEWAQDPRTRTPLAAHQVKGDSIVSINGMEMTVDQAVMIGLLAHPNQGDIPVAVAPQGVAKEAQQQQPEDVHPDLQTEALDRATETTFTTLVENTSAGTQIAAVQDIATDGAISERRLAELASQMMAEPSQVQAMVDSMKPAFEAQANKVAEDLGIDPEAFFAWAYEAKPQEMQAAINRHLTLRNTHGYTKLAQHFVQHLDSINPELLLNAEVIGGKVERIGGKIVLTDAKGRRMTWGEALALGYKPERVR